MIRPLDANFRRALEVSELPEDYAAPLRRMFYGFDAKFHRALHDRVAVSDADLWTLRRKTGAPYVSHPISVCVEYARLTEDMQTKEWEGLDSAILLAARIHDKAEDKLGLEGKELSESEKQELRKLYIAMTVRDSHAILDFAKKITHSRMSEGRRFGFNIRKVLEELIPRVTPGRHTESKIPGLLTSLGDMCRYRVNQKEDKVQLITALVIDAFKPGDRINVLETLFPNTKLFQDLVRQSRNFYTTLDDLVSPNGQVIDERAYNSFNVQRKFEYESLLTQARENNISEIESGKRTDELGKIWVTNNEFMSRLIIPTMEHANPLVRQLHRRAVRTNLAMLQAASETGTQLIDFLCLYGEFKENPVVLRRTYEKSAKEHLESKAGLTYQDEEGKSGPSIYGRVTANFIEREGGDKEKWELYAKQPERHLRDAILFKSQAEKAIGPLKEYDEALKQFHEKEKEIDTEAHRRNFYYIPNQTQAMRRIIE